MKTVSDNALRTVVEAFLFVALLVAAALLIGAERRIDVLQTDLIKAKEKLDVMEKSANLRPPAAVPAPLPVVVHDCPKLPDAKPTKQTVTARIRDRSTLEVARACMAGRISERNGIYIIRWE